MWDSSDSRFGSWKCFAVLTSVEGLLPIISIKTILLNEQVKLVVQMRLPRGNSAVIPSVMVQYKSDVGACSSIIVETKQRGWNIPAAVLHSRAHDGDGCWRFWKSFIYEDRERS